MNAGSRVGDFVIITLAREDDERANEVRVTLVAEHAHSFYRCTKSGSFGRHDPPDTVDVMIAAWLTDETNRLRWERGRHPDWWSCVACDWINQPTATRCRTCGGSRSVMDTAKIEAIARVAHEANRGWCEAHGDLSQKVWELAAEWQRASAINGVRFVLEHPDAGDSAQHENWMREKVADGWVYGEVKDAEAKTHPCLVSFAQLPPMQQAKDKLFRAVVLALA